ncbi:MAG: hypothetical protein R3C29_06930 [Dehalococcoidia bacterium]
MRTYEPQTMRLDHLGREPEPAALYREQASRAHRPAGKTARSVDAARLDALRTAVRDSVLTRGPFV